MLSVIDIIGALSPKLESVFPDFPVNDRDEKEGFARPSFFVDIENVVDDIIAQGFVRETANLTIYFFAEDVYKGFLRLLEVKETLRDMLEEPLRIENGDEKAHITFDDVTIEVSKADKALKAELSAVLIQKSKAPDSMNPEMTMELETNFN